MSQTASANPWEAANLWVERDRDTTLRHLRHVVHPVPYDAVADREEVALRMVALAYLTDAVSQVQRGYGLTPEQLSHLARSMEQPDTSPPACGFWFRWLPIRHAPAGGGAASFVVPLAQFVAPRSGGGARRLDVLGGGLRVAVRRRVQGSRYEVVASNSTAQQDVSLARALDSGDEVDALFRLADADVVAAVMRALGQETDPVGYQVTRFATTLQTARLHPAIAAGTEAAVECALSVRRQERRRLEQVAMRDPRTGVLAAPFAPPVIGCEAVVTRGRNGLLSVGPIRAQAACCTGRAFPQDPPSATGRVAKWPDLPEGELDAARKWVTLERLNGSVPQGLAGEHVAIVSPNALRIAAPTSPFDFSARSDDFAAVNAYYHCDAMFQLAREFGFDDSNLFFPHGQAGGPSQFPVAVAHRAPMTLVEPDTASAPFTNPQVFTVNAQVTAARGIVGGLDTATQVAEMRFALGSLADGPTTPLPPADEDGTSHAFGVAADARWAWHEFGHVLITAATGKLRLPFAHSVGDALAAIMCDPDSAFAHPPDNPLRGVTFPFVEAPQRRHDRRAEVGWGWLGQMVSPVAPDPADAEGYAAEEVLSSTLFRLYRSIGGDALLADGNPDRPQRRAAARYVAYLIMRALATLGPAQWVPATPGVFASALMAADADTGIFEHEGIRRLGGAAIKLIRWAFERQGLYHPPGPWPQNGPGLAEPVDLHAGDGDGGYGIAPAGAGAPDPLRSQAIERVTQGSGGGVVELVAVKVANRGQAVASGVTVRAWTRSGAGCDIWEEGAWTALTPDPGSPLPPHVPPKAPAQTMGYFPWAPAGQGPHAVLFVVEAPGDRSLLHPASGLACAKGPIPVAELLAGDNNLAYRCWP